MSVLKQLASKPWELADREYADHGASSDTAKGSAKARYTALRWLLAVISVMFMLFFITFISRTQFSDFQALSGEPWLPLSDKTPLWFNTAFIALASIILQILCTRFALLPRWKVNALMALSMVCTFAFLFGQLSVWNHLLANGYYLQTNPANSFFFLLTGLHGVHLVVGLIVLTVTLLQCLIKPGATDIFRRIDLTRIYWHYLFILWVVLMLLLTSSTQTFKVIAELCGF